MGMNILQACEDFFITGIRMMVGFRFLFFTQQNPVLPKASAVMRMFFERTGQVSIFIKAVPGMGVLFNFTYNLRVYIVAVFRVAVAFSFFQAAGQFILIAAVIMLMFFDPACSGLLKCNCGKKECIGCAKDDNAGQDTDKTSEKAAAMSISHISSDTFFQLCIPQII